MDLHMPLEIMRQRCLKMQLWTDTPMLPRMPDLQAVSHWVVVEGQAASYMLLSIVEWTPTASASGKPGGDVG
jgi:hypothetical protein